MNRAGIEIFKTNLTFAAFHCGVFAKPVNCLFHRSVDSAKVLDPVASVYQDEYQSDVFFYEKGVKALFSPAV